MHTSQSFSEIIASRFHEVATLTFRRWAFTAEWHSSPRTVRLVTAQTFRLMDDVLIGDMASTAGCGDQAVIEVIDRWRLDLCGFQVPDATVRSGLADVALSYGLNREVRQRRRSKKPKGLHSVRVDVVCRSAIKPLQKSA